MSQEEKLFNLQLIIQKLEEELSLYRNGTTAAELMELINEKDVEIETWRAKCEEKDDKLRRLAKTSGDVLLKYEKLQEELQRQHQHINETEFIIKDYNDQILELENRMKQLEIVIAEKNNELKQKDDAIGSLRLELWDHKQNIDSKIREEQDKYDETISNLKMLQEQKDDLLSKANQTAKDNGREMEHLQSDLQKFKNICADQEASIEKLQKRCATLIAEKSDKLKQLDIERQEMIQHIQQFRESMNQNLAQRDEALRRKDDKIRELQFQISLLQQQLKSKIHRPVGTSNATGGGIATDAINFNIMIDEVPESTTNTVKPAVHSRAPLGEKTNAITSSGVTAGIKKNSNKY